MAQSDTVPSRDLSPAEAPLIRQGWEEQYQRMAENGDDVLSDADAPALTEWDETEWEW